MTTSDVTGDVRVANPKLSLQKSAPKPSKALNPGDFDPNELYRRLELYKQQQKQARRLREVRSQQGLKAESKPASAAREEHSLKSDDIDWRTTAVKAHQQAPMHPRKVSLQTIEHGPRLAEDECPVIQAPYRPRSAAIDFQKTATAGAGRKPNENAPSEVAVQDKRYTADGLDRHESSRAEALCILNGESFHHTGARRPTTEKRKSRQSRAQVERSSGSEGMETVQSFQSDECQKSRVLGGQLRTESRARKQAVLHNEENSSAYRQDSAEHGQHSVGERSSLRKKLSRLVLLGPRKAETADKTNDDEELSAIRSRRRSSLMAIFK